MSSSDEESGVSPKMSRSQPGRSRASSHSMKLSYEFKGTNKTGSPVMSRSELGRRRGSSHSLDIIVNFTGSEETEGTLMSRSERNRASSHSMDTSLDFKGSTETGRPASPSALSQASDSSTVFISESEDLRRSQSGGSLSRASSHSLGEKDQYKRSQNKQNTPFNRSGSLKSVSDQSICSLSSVPEQLDNEDRMSDCSIEKPLSLSGSTGVNARSSSPTISRDSGIASWSGSRPVSILTEKKLRAVIPPSAGPDDVSCDFCTGSKCKAWKSCLTCLRSFCEKHVRDHYRYKELEEHQLTEVTADLNVYKELAELKQENRKLSKENRALRENIKQSSSTPSLPTFICKGKTPTAADVLLDPETAHRALVISDHGKRVRMGQRRTVQPGPLRFDRWECVLAKNAFSSGRHYWQVEVNKEFLIGVMKSSAQRNGRFAFAPFQGFWCIFHFWLSFSALEDHVVRLSINSVPRVLGVCVDVDEKWVKFYNVETKEEIYTFANIKLAPGDQVYPIFRTVEKSIDLQINTVI